MTKAEKLEFINRHLFYELRMLLGASEVIKLFDEYKLGNTCSLVRDSAYVHIRNVYNFFSGDPEHDIGVHEFINLDFDLRLYRTWKSILHRNMLHIQKHRNKKENKVDGVTISEMIHTFAEDIVKNWELWINNEQDDDINKTLIDVLVNARNEAGDDYSNTKMKFK